MRSALLAAFLLVLAPAVARAETLNGTWEGHGGVTRISFAPCAPGLCGRIIWIKPGARSRARLNAVVFSHLAPTGNGTWIGDTTNPEDGRTYQSTVTVAGRQLLVKGCVLGGMICKSETWTRVG